MSDVTRILDRVQQGTPKRQRNSFRWFTTNCASWPRTRWPGEAPGQTLQPTALVHEAWLRLVGVPEQHWDGRGHFFAAAAEAMRRILVDNARRKQSLKHGGGLQRVDFAHLDVALVEDDATILAVSEALDRLTDEDPRCAELIKLRFFAGLSNVQAARMLGMAERTAKRTWAYARARLYEELKQTL